MSMLTISFVSMCTILLGVMVQECGHRSVRTARTFYGRQQSTTLLGLLWSTSTDTIDYTTKQFYCPVTMSSVSSEIHVPHWLQFKNIHAGVVTIWCQLGYTFRSETFEHLTEQLQDTTGYYYSQVLPNLYLRSCTFAVMKLTELWHIWDRGVGRYLRWGCWGGRWRGRHWHHFYNYTPLNHHFCVILC